MARNELIHERLTYSIIGSFYEVNNTLGLGFFEGVYMSALERELIARGHRVEREVWVPVWYKGEVVARQRVDMIVDETVIVEGKATFQLHSDAGRQPYSYVRSTKFEVALLLHFNPKPRAYRFTCRNECPPSEKVYPHDPTRLSDRV